MSHTPGPWKVESGLTYVRVVSEAAPMQINCFGPRGEANARLIAAAPDLLKAAKKALDRGFFETKEVVEGLEVAIKKATE